MSLTLGKLCPKTLKKLIDEFRGADRPELVAGSMLGRDCGLLDMKDSLVSVTCDPITGETSRAGWLAVQVVTNDLIASGAEPVALLISLIFPPGTTETAIVQTMQDIDRAAQSLNITIAGGHTELSDVVNRPLIQCTGVGRLKKNGYPDVSRLKPGDHIMMTKTAGIEGTALLAETRQKLLSVEMEPDELSRARDFMNHISIVPEGRIARAHDVHCLHDVTEGGIAGAVWEVCTGQNLGFSLEEELVPVHELTETMCRILSLDPLKLISSGTLLVFLPDPNRLKAELNRCGIPATCIGQVKKSPDHRVILRKTGTIESVETCPPDELWRVDEQMRNESKCH